MPTPVSFRLFQEQDIPFGMHLKRLAGWNQVPDDWRRFLTLGPEGCFVAVLDDGSRTPVGTATTTAYGDRFGWVGMVLVLPDFRRQGIGTKLLLHALKYLENKGVTCQRLDATPLGKKLYDTLGFQDEYPLERVKGTGKRMSSEGVQKMGAVDVRDVSRYDAPIFGASRRRMLEILHEQSPNLCFVTRTGKRDVCGFLMARPGENAWQIGPWVADSPELAEQLLRAGLNALNGQPVFLDVLPTRNEGTRLVASYGFSTQRPFIRMFRGGNAHPGQPSHVYAICGVETG